MGNIHVAKPRVIPRNQCYAEMFKPCQMQTKPKAVMADMVTNLLILLGETNTSSIAIFSFVPGFHVVNCIIILSFFCRYHQLRKFPYRFCFTEFSDSWE
jgi:hypothetical protein